MRHFYKKYVCSLSKRFTIPPYSLSRAPYPSRLELLSPTHNQHSQQQSGVITLKSSLTNKPKFLNSTSYTNKNNCTTEVHYGGGVELETTGRNQVSSRPKPCACLENASGILIIRHSLLAIVGRKPIVVRGQLLPHKHPGSRL